MYLLKTELQDNDIEVYGHFVEEDQRNAGYNIGDLLNIPYLGGWWNANPHHTIGDLKRMYIIGNAYPKSILSFYIEHRPYDEIVPYIPRIHGALLKYEEIHRVSLQSIIDQVKQDDILCVHVRSGDKDVEESFMHLIQKMSRSFSKVMILSGLHLDQYFQSNSVKKAQYISSMNQILHENPNSSLIIAEPDVHLIVLKYASHLLLHKGGFSVIGSIVSTGQLYITSLLQQMLESENWKRLVNKPYLLINETNWNQMVDLRQIYSGRRDENEVHNTQSGSP